MGIFKSGKSLEVKDVKKDAEKVNKINVELKEDEGAEIKDAKMVLNYMEEFLKVLVEDEHNLEELLEKAEKGEATEDDVEELTQEVSRMKERKQYIVGGMSNLIKLCEQTVDAEEEFKKILRHEGIEDFQEKEIELFEKDEREAIHSGKRMMKEISKTLDIAVSMEDLDLDEIRKDPEKNVKKIRKVLSKMNTKATLIEQGAKDIKEALTSAIKRMHVNYGTNEKLITALQQVVKMLQEAGDSASGGVEKRKVSRLTKDLLAKEGVF